MYRYVVYQCTGAGGYFLSQIIASMLGINTAQKISNSGHMHDFGKGNWKQHDEICLCGDYWDELYRDECKILAVHKGPLKKFKNDNKDVKVILIHVDKEDYRKCTEMYVCKAFPDILKNQKNEYDKWKGEDWPEYNDNIIEESEFVKNEFIEGLLSQTITWMENYDSSVVDYTVNFKTIMGVEGDIAQEVSKILNKPVNNEVIQLVKNYQEKNQGLYYV